jgi:hypothetical protein
MSDINLFRLASGEIDELDGTTDTIEKSVQILFEKNLEALLGVSFLASEFITTSGGRIDTLGLDENSCPVILEYKRSTNQNVPWDRPDSCSVRPLGTLLEWGMPHDLFKTAR